jgi:AGCS family alanine or glycine:cation symporter
MTKILESVNSLVWGIPALVLILGVGFYLSLRTGFV